MDPDFPAHSVQKANVIVNNVSPFYALVGVGLGMIVAILANGCASPASADSYRETVEAPVETVMIVESESMVVREDSRLVVRTEMTDEVAPEARSAPIHTFVENDALVDAGLRVGDEVLLVTDGFESHTVDSYGALEDAYTRISAAVDDNDSYLDVLIRRDGSNWWITVTAVPTT
jgi:hypothetical protein